MSEFDAIIVGAGPAGSAAAIRLASKEQNVLLVEKSDPPGSKNVSGGVLWGNDLTNVIPDWEKTAPVERFVETKSVAFLTKESKIGVDFSSKKFENQKTGYTVLRAKFDQYLAKKAKDAGAMVASGVTVDKLAFDNGKVIGVEQNGDVITADTVVLAEGANPRVAIESGLRKPLGDHDVAIGVKEVVKLTEPIINERFNLKGKSGYACEYVLGFLEGGVHAGGFLYTNKDSISLGAVISMKSLRQNNQTYSFDIIEQFKEHPYIAPLLEGGRVEEYSAHMVVEGGLQSVPKLYGDGFMVAGDGAGFSFSNGMVLQGMNYAIASGIQAADTFLDAKGSGDFSSSSLSKYKERLKESYVLKDLHTFNGISDLTWSPFMHEKLPQVLESTMLGIFMEEGKPKKHMSKILRESMAESGLSTSEMLLQGYRMMRRM